MEKLRNTLLNDSVRGRQTTMYRAQRLAEYTLYDGDPHLINTEVERYLAVTPDEIKDVVARYLHTDNHALIEITPAPEGSEEAEPAADAPTRSKKSGAARRAAPTGAAAPARARTRPPDRDARNAGNAT
jgi:hypothetical protein